MHWTLTTVNKERNKRNKRQRELPGKWKREKGNVNSYPNIE